MLAHRAASSDGVTSRWISARSSRSSNGPAVSESNMCSIRPDLGVLVDPLCTAGTGTADGGDGDGGRGGRGRGGGGRRGRGRRGRGRGRGRRTWAQRSRTTESTARHGQDGTSRGRSARRASDSATSHRGLMRYTTVVGRPRPQSDVRLTVARHDVGRVVEGRGLEKPVADELARRRGSREPARQQGRLGKQRDRERCADRSAVRRRAGRRRRAAPAPATAAAADAAPAAAPAAAAAAGSGGRIARRAGRTPRPRARRRRRSGRWWRTPVHLRRRRYRSRNVEESRRDGAPHPALRRALLHQVVGARRGRR
jgi:hypothetical protein